MRTAGGVLASDGDLVVEVIEQDHQSQDAAGDQHIRTSATFQVSKSRTAEYIDLSKTDATHVYDHVVIQGETIKAARLWLQTFHSTPDLDSWALQNFSITDVFHVIKFGQTYVKTRKQGAELDNGENKLRPAKDLSMLRQWFQAWYDHHIRSNQVSRSVTTVELLLAPAYWFDCAVIFRDVTKELAYGSARYLGDLAPRGVPGMDIHGIPGPVLIYRYFVALDATGSFPVNYGENRHKSVNRLLGDAENIRLEIIELNPDTRHASWICNPYRQGNATRTARTLEAQVKEGINCVRKKFEGLCLDCMHKYKTGDKDCDYWNHARAMNFSKGCRFPHGEPTWYYSYMGRDDEMKKFKTITTTPGKM
ncbi:hypothetical protein DL769_004304 [Monosporascus sp. CRB-8-3]|nr:hypothetical protein DL769_004304 [Monosporascus sp. CRB-8-3]